MSGWNENEKPPGEQSAKIKEENMFLISKKSLVW